MNKKSIKTQLLGITIMLIGIFLNVFSPYIPLTIQYIAIAIFILGGLVALSGFFQHDND